MCKSGQLFFSFVSVSLSFLRLLVCNALCGSSTRTRERGRQAGRAAVPGAVETDLERGQRYHRTRLIVRGA